MSNLPSHQTGALIVGGGLVGLCAGLFLQRHDVPFVLVERNRQASPLPRARGLAVRTMELFRQVGVEEEVQAAVKAAWEMGVFGGARRGRTMLESAALDLPHDGEKMKGNDPSPSQFGACPQTYIEQVLRRRLEARGGDVRFGCELVDFHDDGDAVTAIVRDQGGRDASLTASYLLGADGARSFVRKRLGIALVGAPPREHYVNLFFRADLAEHVRGRTFSQCEVANARVQGLFLAMNNTDKWSFHLRYDPAAGPSPAELPDEALTDLLRAAIGLEDVPIEILHKGNWNTAARVAARYRSGRVLLAGDAAHLMPPWGGLNGNGGVADAHNLAWKLAAVLKAQAASGLLDSYETERRPVAIRNGEQALLRTDFEARFGIRTEANAETFTNLLDAGSLLVRYRYPSPTVSSDQPVERLCGQTGTRFPHAWIQHDGKSLSTLDLFGGAYVLLVGPGATGRWTPDAASALPHGPLPVHAFGAGCELVDGGVDWQRLTGLPNDGAVLVRPDGFVADRSDETLRPTSSSIPYPSRMAGNMGARQGGPHPTR